MAGFVFRKLTTTPNIYHYSQRSCRLDPETMTDVLLPPHMQIERLNPGPIHENAQGRVMSNHFWKFSGEFEIFSGRGVEVVFERLTRYQDLSGVSNDTPFSLWILDSLKFYTCSMGTTLSKPPRSPWRNFVYDLVTVDFHQAMPLSLSVRVAILLTVVLVLGLITCHVLAGRYSLGRNSICVGDKIQLRPKGHELASC